MRHGKVLFIFLAGGLLLLPACNLPPPTYVCVPSELVAPKLVIPIDYAKLPTTTPLLSWEFKSFSYPSPQDQPSLTVACQPESYRISISTAPFYMDELGMTEPGTALAGGVTSPTLQSGKTYRWNVTASSGGVDGPTSATHHFSIGNTCGAADLQAPNLLWPPNDWKAISLTPPFRWETTMTCLPDGYLFRIAKDPALTVQGGTIGGPNLEGALDWVGHELENCVYYYWRVAAYLGEPPAGLGPFEGKPGVGPSSETRSFQVHLPATSCWVPGQPTPTATTESLQIIDQTWEVTRNANCRAGPGTLHNETGFAPKGYAAPVEGRNEDGTWFRLTDPNGVLCWVSSIALAVPENWQDLEVLAYPTPPPAPEEEEEVVNCSRFTDYPSCIAQPACIWDRVNSACKNP